MLGDIGKGVGRIVFRTTPKRAAAQGLEARFLLGGERMTATKHEKQAKRHLNRVHAVLSLSWQALQLELDPGLPGGKTAAGYSAIQLFRLVDYRGPGGRFSAFATPTAPARIVEDMNSDSAFPGCQEERKNISFDFGERSPVNTNAIMKLASATCTAHFLFKM